MTLDDARALDAADPLAPLRQRFILPDDLIYLNGNSLGPLTRDAAGNVDRLVCHEWGERLARSWNEAGWRDASTRIGGKIARVIGAAPEEVVVADSTSVCLYKLLAAAAALGPGDIAAEAHAFPTDRYIAESVAAQLGRSFRAVDRPEDAILAGTAVALLADVDYRLGDRFDMAALSARARDTGTQLIWDLSHSVGAVPIDLRRDGATLAAGCGYKYLNGGPGAPAFLYVARELQASLPSVIPGWWSHHRPFDFAPEHLAAEGITRFLSGTPPVIGLAALEGGVDVMLDADPPALRHKAMALWSLFVDELAWRCPSLVLRTPCDPARRGSHATFEHPQAGAIVRAAAAARGVIGDHRPPVFARFGLTPLTLRYADAWRAAEIIAEVVASEPWRDPRFAATTAVP